MISAKLLTFAASLAFLQSTVLCDLQCYQCRGADCSVPSPDQLITCGQATQPTTDSDMHFDDDIETVQVIDVPLLETIESPEWVTEEVSGLVIDASVLPGADRFSFRRLKQADSEDDVRCVVATYTDEDSGVSTVRTCSIFNISDQNTCQNHVNGELLSCYVCDTDGCNSAGRTMAGLLTLAAVLVSVIRFRESC